MITKEQLIAAATEAELVFQYDGSGEVFVSFREDTDVAGCFEAMAKVLNAATAAQPENQEPKLDKPAMVGSVQFKAGVAWSTVIEAAQRRFENQAPTLTDPLPVGKSIHEALLDGIKTGEGRYLVRKPEPHEVPPRLMTGVCGGIYNRTEPSRRYDHTGFDMAEPGADQSVPYPFPFLDRSRN